MTKCGPNCIAQAQLLDVADGEEHSECPPPVPEGACETCGELTCVCPEIDEEDE